MTVYKYQFEPNDEINFMLPEGAEILHVAVQHKRWMMWAKVDQLAPKLVKRTMLMRGTGHDITGNNLRYINTVMYDHGALVFHFFEVL